MLIGADFDRFVETQCAQAYAPRRGRPSLPPGRYFRMLLIGYFGRRRVGGKASGDACSGLSAGISIPSTLSRLPPGECHRSNPCRSVNSPRLCMLSSPTRPARSGRNLPEGAGTTTIDSRTNFIGAAPEGTRLIGEATPVHRGGHTMSGRRGSPPMQASSCRWSCRLSSLCGRCPPDVARAKATPLPCNRRRPVVSVTETFPALACRSRSA